MKCTPDGTIIGVPVPVPADHSAPPRPTTAPPTAAPPPKGPPAPSAKPTAPVPTASVAPSATPKPIAPTFNVASRAMGQPNAAEPKARPTSADHHAAAAGGEPPAKAARVGAYDPCIHGGSGGTRLEDMPVLDWASAYTIYMMRDKAMRLEDKYPGGHWYSLCTVADRPMGAKLNELPPS
eukprot:5616615-Pyramimonas_sp.AAC.1